MGHHYIPQIYLRGFAAPTHPDAVWQFDKATRRFSDKPASIKNIAQERSFYDPETERKLNELVEAPGNAVLEKLRSGALQLNDGERTQLAVYIATMLKRVPHHRQRGVAIAPQALASTVSELREIIRAATNGGQMTEALAQRGLTEIDAVQAKFSAELPPNIIEQIRSPWPSETIVDLIYGANWQFVCAAGGNHFVTTDNPAFFFTSYGLGTEHSEFTFPISSDLAIFGTRRHVAGKRVMTGKSQYVKEANRRLISGATRFVWSGKNWSWIPAVAGKSTPYLSQIRW